MKTNLVLPILAVTAGLSLTSCGVMDAITGTNTSGNVSALAHGMRLTPNSHRWYYPGEGEVVTGSSYPRPATRNATTYCPQTGRLVDLPQ
jgi:hypothetical protein